MDFTFNGNRPNIVTFNGNDVETVKCNNVVVWRKRTLEYLTFTAVQANSTVTYTTAPYKDTSAEYSTDGIQWLNANDLTVTLLNVGDKVYYRGVIGQSIENSYSDYPVFEMTGKIAASGSLMSMVNKNPDEKIIPYKSIFMRLFYNCKELTTLPELPATQLTEFCYANMFTGCSGITTAPELPATTLANDCYAYMFHGCTSLVNAPELPAKILLQSCYDGMFGNCTSLNSVTCLATDLIFGAGTSNWLNGTARNGILTVDYNMGTQWTQLPVTSGKPSGWNLAFK